mmetsp:Transcript_60706/g.143474  ORF Transcript_60706/g.143474 Transcript_60706/m.143474 type:complete len:93 (-) Transcript_60706:3484-3762(-)
MTVTVAADEDITLDRTMLLTAASTVWNIVNDPPWEVNADVQRANAWYCREVRAKTAVVDDQELPLALVCPMVHVPEKTVTECPKTVTDADAV